MSNLFRCFMVNEAHMSNIHKQMLPLVRNHHLLKAPYDSYHWYEWTAPQSTGIPFVNCISLLFESRAKAICRLVPLVQIDSTGKVFSRDWYAICKLHILTPEDSA